MSERHAALIGRPATIDGVPVQVLDVRRVIPESRDPLGDAYDMVLVSWPLGMDDWVDGSRVTAEGTR